MSRDEHQRYDRSSKWLIQHYGDSLLRLADIENIEAWRSVQAEVVQPRQLPDGLLDVRLSDAIDDIPFLLEIAAYPERRVNEQLTRDAMLVYLDRGEWPEVVVVVLAPKGKYRIPRQRRLRSRLGLSACNVTWRVVELWNIPADRLLEAGDVGLIPWVLLADSSESPTVLAQRCREAIDRRATPIERGNLLAVTQVLSHLRYDDSNLLTILGGQQIMSEFPLIQEIVDEIVDEAVSQRAHKSILEVLAGRFGDLPQELEDQFRSVTDDDELSRLTRSAATCSSLDEFRQTLS